MKRYYIAYGSNLSLEQMARRCPTAKVVGTAMLKDWRLLFNGPASIEKKVGYQVPVLIWDIQPSDEKSLDRYEGYPNYYRKEMIKININGKPEEAMVYIMNTNKESRPGTAYYQILENGYKRFEFDMVILRRAFYESYKREKRYDY